MTVQRQLDSDLAVWDAQVLRLTAFPTNPEGSLEGHWWRQLLGEEPEESTTKKSLQRTEEGPYEGHYLQFTVDPVRMQWGLFPAVDPATLSAGFPTMGALPGVLEGFTSLMEKWLAISPPIQRLAFGAVLLQSAESHESAYETLNKYLRAVDLDPKSTDFSYRINRCRPSRCGIDGLIINRLSTWAALRWTTHLIGVAGRASRKILPVQPYASRLELDINSAADFEQELAKKSLAGLWRELLDLGREIAAKGDVP